MPVARATPESKRRVRTGCLSCRRRRRKCDETKPRCGNCEAKLFSCKYPTLTFVSSRENESEDAGKQKAASYSSITFVDERFSTPASQSSESDTRNHRLPEIASKHIASHVVNRIDAVLNTVAKDPNLGARRPRRDANSDGEECPLSNWDSYFSTRQVSSSSKERALFRHFRYKMVPWIEAGDPSSQFGVDAMRLGQESPPIHAAILAISSRQLQLISASNHDRDNDMVSYQQQARSGLFSLHGETRRAGEALMALDAFLSSRPSQWRNIPLFDLKQVSTDGSVHSVEEPLQTLYRLHARIDLAASLLTGQPPLTSLAFHASHPSQNTTFNSSARAAYNRSLHHLTAALHFIHGDAQSLPSPSFGQSDPTLSSFASLTTFTSRWLSLWADCQSWYETRTSMMRPILDIRSVEAGRIDPEDRSSFPIQIYTTAIALHANIAYHMASLLILSQRPRLVKLPTHQRYVASQSWHAQTIAGIATKNVFAEQWDPVLVSAVLIVAKEMTHPSQQRALLTCFADITAKTGINLEQEIHELRSNWNTARQ